MKDKCGQRVRVVFTQMGYLKLKARHLDRTINKSSFWCPPHPPEPRFTPLDALPVSVRVWQLCACAAACAPLKSCQSERSELDAEKIMLFLAEVKPVTEKEGRTLSQSL